MPVKVSVSPVRGLVFRRTPKCLMDSPLAAKGIPQSASRPETAAGFPSSNPWDLPTFSDEPDA
jgi:hypothetical protein